MYGVLPLVYELDAVRLTASGTMGVLVVVNTGFGDSHSAAEEVQYVNGSADTPMGKWRAKNGSREPFKVVWWGVGNEMFGNWQLGYMSLEHYALKHNEVAKKMGTVKKDYTDP